MELGLVDNLLMALGSRSLTEDRFMAPDIARGYVVGTGWWCDETSDHAGTQFNESTDYIRTRDFFRLWYACVDRYTDPEKILVVDSNSPVRPKLPDDDRLEFLSLAENFGHYVDCDPARMCGVERVHLMCALYAYLNDCDLIYIEQDCLVLGEGWVDRCYENWSEGKIMYGDGEGTPQPQQQSLVLVARPYIPIFIQRLLVYFFAAREELTQGAPIGPRSPEKRWHQAFKKDVDYLPFGYGRARPLDFDARDLYAQHWEQDELNEALVREGLEGFFEVDADK
jgi:hypothetical protein